MKKKYKKKATTFSGHSNRDITMHVVLNCMKSVEDLKSIKSYLYSHHIEKWQKSIFPSLS